MQTSLLDHIQKARTKTQGSSILPLLEETLERQTPSFPNNTLLKQRSYYLSRLLFKHCSNIRSALEVEFKTGGNLHFLKSRLGFDVTATSSNPFLPPLFKKMYPDLAKNKIYLGPPLRALQNVPSKHAELVFTMNSFKRFSLENKTLFWRHLIRVAKKAIVLIESEEQNRLSDAQILQYYGAKPIHQEACPQDLWPNSTARVFLLIH